MKTAALYRLKSLRSLSICLLHKTALMAIVETLSICLPAIQNLRKNETVK